MLSVNHSRLCRRLEGCEEEKQVGQALTRETNTHKWDKHIKEGQTHTSVTKTQKWDKHTQVRQTHTSGIITNN